MAIKDLFNSVAEAATKAGKDAAGFLDKAGKDAAGAVSKAAGAVAKAVDANGDGKFDFNDIKAAANSVGGAAQKAFEDAKAYVDDSIKQAEIKKNDAKYKADLEELKPIFPEDITDPGYGLSRLIRITTPDKKRKESEACNGAIGYYTVSDDMRVVNIYKTDFDKYGIAVYPDTECEVYYVDPVDRDSYIALNGYFDTLRKKRLAELELVAQSLGATEFTVKYYEEHQTADKGKIAVNAKAGSAKADAQVEKGTKTRTSMRIEARMQCLGHAPERPELKYLANDLATNHLIELRMNGNPIHSHSYSIHLSESSGIKQKEAVKIDNTLKAMKCSLGESVESQANKESMSYFEYEIKFN